MSNNEQPSDHEGKTLDPNPQTLSGTVQQHGKQHDTIVGIGSPMINMTDCLKKWRYVNRFVINTSDAPGSTVFQWDPWAIRGLAQTSGSYYNMHWQDASLLCCEYMNVVPIFRFMLISQSMITGRYQFHYSPDYQILDSDFRNPVLEWDLSASRDIDLAMPSYSQMGTRPTRLANNLNVLPSPQTSVVMAMPYSYYKAGYFYLRVMNPVQALSIFPSTYDVLIFQSFIPISQACITNPWHSVRISSNGTPFPEYVLDFNPGSTV